MADNTHSTLKAAGYKPEQGTVPCHTQMTTSQNAGTVKVTSLVKTLANKKT